MQASTLNFLNFLEIVLDFITQFVNDTLILAYAMTQCRGIGN